MANRADRMLSAIEATDGLGYWDDPLRSLENILGDSLSDLEHFLPLWIARIERDIRPSGDWESDRERWLREAITRRDGLEGLARVARATRRPEAVTAWCRAVVAQGDWATSLAVYEEAAALISSATWRGDFLDGAALAAQVLKRKDRTTKLESAWLGAPSLVRLLRWLLAEDPSAVALKKRSSLALDANATRSPRLLGLLHVLVGNVPAAANVLKKAPGLGWSTGDHPGHLLFSVFAWLCGRPHPGSVCEELAQTLSGPGGSEFENETEFVGHDSGDARKDPQLAKPSVIDALQRADILTNFSRDDRKEALAALKSAATKRMDGVLGEKRRRHYAHAALLVACCVELEERREKESSSPWAEALRARTSHFPAFQRELRAALARIQS
jgi:hypothetical protein